MYDCRLVSASGKIRLRRNVASIVVSGRNCLDAVVYLQENQLGKCFPLCFTLNIFIMCTCASVKCLKFLRHLIARCAHIPCKNIKLIHVRVFGKLNM